ncbi:type II toxin-antitoxin system PemK/MazF family toxin [Candidatus Micrarchaeota archaeon]|nr:type II toxin-antitoxin system PemK/MazF family toxin [Candidatus Micrarchaeota archaeon]
MIIRRGDILLAKLDPTLGSEQGKTRPCLVVSDDVSNQFSPNVIIAPITSVIPDKFYPTVVIISPRESGLPKDSAVLCSQIRTISKMHRVIKNIGALKLDALMKVDQALKISLALD